MSNTLLSLSYAKSGQAISQGTILLVYGRLLPVEYELVLRDLLCGSGCCVKSWFLGKILQRMRVIVPRVDK